MKKLSVIIVCRLEQMIFARKKFELFCLKTDFVRITINILAFFSLSRYKGSRLPPTPCYGR